MSIEKEAYIVVDAFSTGKRIPKYLSGLGYQCIHIQSENLPQHFKFEKSDFIKSIFFNGDIESLVLALSNYSIRMCMAGSESGVELCDLISEKLNIQTNGTALSKARRNKYLMIEAVKKAGLKTVKHFKSDSEDKVLEWVKAESAFPVVLKPLDSANGHLVFFCDNEDQLRSASCKILFSKNCFDRVNNEVLVESLNQGQEYIVNSASYNGKHVLVEIWKVTRVESTTIYDFVEIISDSEKEFNMLRDYTFKVLDALGICYGPSTTELKYNGGESPVLIESAARPMGSAPLSLSHKLFGFTL